MALSKDDISEIVALYDGGKGETILALATTYSVSKTTIRNHLDAAGVLVRSGAAPGETDEELGIGDEDEPPTETTDALAALMADPRMAALLDAAVAQRVAQMAAPVQGDGNSLADLTKMFGRMMELNATQQPGYVKPLPVEEVERRLAGKIEMDALLLKYQAAGTPPLWHVGDGGFFECTNAVEVQPGQPMRTYLPPAEDFVPQNEEARNVHAAMMQWLGGRTPEIGEQLRLAQIAAKEVPLISSAPMAVQKPGLIELVDAPTTERGRKRSAGTIVPERHDVSLADRAGGPVGPVFGETRAA